MSKLLVIKLGGSIVTYKDSPIPKARVEVIKDLAKEIKGILEQGYKLLLVHGAGSFAHPIAKKYRIHQGMNTKDSKLGFGLVTDGMLKLNLIIMNELFRLSLQAVSLPMHTFITQSAGELNDFDLNLIEKYLVNEQIPVLFGDAVLDDRWGCSIISGDVIVTYLAKKLKADNIVFLSDVDGIFDSDPSQNPKAKLIPKISNSNINQVLKGLSRTGRDDITGEMKGKLRSIMEDLLGKRVSIINGLIKGNLTKAVMKQRVGTTLLFE